MAKIKKLDVAQNDEEKKKENLFIMVNKGEELGSKLMDLLSEYGASPEGLLIETYALSKAWAALKVVAVDCGYYVDDLFKKLIPSFAEEMKDALKEASKE